MDDFKNYLSPDYDDSFDVDELDEKGNSKEKINNNNMISTPINQINPSNMSTPFGNFGSTTSFTPNPQPWNQVKPNTSSPSYSSLGGTDNTGMAFKGTGTIMGNNAVEIDRSKKIIVCDFLDCIVETLSSNGVPGLIPRDIYDLKPKFDAWNKLSAFNPEGIVVLVPINLIPETNGFKENWLLTIDYFCASLCSFLRIPFGSCTAATYDPGISKTETLGCVVDSMGIDKKDIVNIGIYSGVNGQSNRDKVAADIVGVTYVDLVDLINKMF